MNRHALNKIITPQLMEEQVKSIMFRNLKKGYSKLLKEHYCYVQPSASKYHFQWFWDNFFHIYIWCALKEYHHARLCLKSLFAMQQRDGFVGHMIYWKSTLPKNAWNVLQARPTLRQFRPHMSSLIQPTLAAQSLEQIYEDTKDEAFLREMLPKIQKYHEWLMVNRCFEHNGLIFIISPFESGIDEKPSYDPLIGSSPAKGTFKQYLQLMHIDARNFFHRYHLPNIYRANKFIVKDTAMNTIYALDLFALSRLFRIVGNEPEALRFEQAGNRVTNSILTLMYNEDDVAFYDLAGKENRQLKTLTFSIFFPIALPNIPATIIDKLLTTHFHQDTTFNLPFPIPSVAKSEPVFNPTDGASVFFDFLWRGPTWMFTNWFLYKALLAKGYTNEAAKLFESSCRLIDIGGFREYYNPLTGEGYGAKDFTWSGLILDMMRQHRQAVS